MLDLIENRKEKTELYRSLDAFFCYRVLGFEKGKEAYPGHAEFFLQNRHRSYPEMEAEINAAIRALS
jgi:hypothetical protein